MKDSLHEFKQKLSDLLKEYDVEISAEDEYQGYPECGEDIQIKFYINGRHVDGEYKYGIEDRQGSTITHESILK